MIYLCEYDGTIGKKELLELANSLPITLPEIKNERIWESCRQRIIAWLLLQHAVREQMGKELCDLQIKRTDLGKPMSELYPEIQFNISHCEKACACVLANFPCGIDIEKKFSFRAALAKRITSPQEWKALQEMSEVEKEKALQKYWSLKESFVKMNGKGLSYGMDRIDTLSENDYYWENEKEWTLAVWPKRAGGQSMKVLESTLKARS